MDRTAQPPIDCSDLEALRARVRDLEAECASLRTQSNGWSAKTESGGGVCRDSEHSGHWEWAEEALRAGEARFRDFAESASDWFWESDSEHRLTWISDRLEQVLGLKPTDVIGQTRWELQGSDPLRDPYWREHQELLDSHQPFYDFAYVFERDGQAFHLAVSGRPVFDSEGTFTGYRGTARDITERKLAELALQEAKAELDERVRQRTAELRQTNEALVNEIRIRKEAEAAAEQSRLVLAQAVEAADEGFVIFDAEERLVLCNSKFRDFYAAVGEKLFEPGTRLEDLARATARHCLGISDEQEVKTWVKGRLEQHRTSSWPRIRRHVDGRWIRTGESRLPNGWNVGTRTDVTEIKKHELDLAERAESIGLLQRVGTFIGEASEIEPGLQACLREVCAHFGWQFGHAFSTESDGGSRLLRTAIWHSVDEEKSRDLYETLTAKPFSRVQGLPGRVLQSEQIEELGDLASDQRLTSCAGGGGEAGLRWACAMPISVGGKISVLLEFFSERPTELDEKVRGTLAALGDQLGHFIERNRAEAAVKRSERQLRQVIDLVPLMIYAKSADGRFTLANRAVAETMGTTVEEVIGKRPDDFLDLEPESTCFQADESVIAGKTRKRDAEDEFVDRSGQRRILQTIGVPFEQAGYDSTVALGVAMDVTEQREQERQLQQAQKMDAVGKLTGGVAHDFNNLLFVIQGNLQLLEEEIGESEDLGQLVEAIKRAASMGADLTRSLLAFSRQQPLKPERLDLVPVIEGSVALLRRTLTEDILIEPRFDRSIWPVFVDRFQLENAIINLAVNARDAMVDGGKLELTVTNCRVRARKSARRGKAGSGPESGDYVKIEVSDDGSGMPGEVIERAFEPFYTTKLAGAGTGLGLSMVYGFVKQSDGHIEIKSKEGRGTCVTILLPKAQEKLDHPENQSGESQREAADQATILVTEDDREVRRVAVRILRKLGYETLEAANGREALDLLERSPQVSLLFTDVIMPGGMNGRQLAEEAMRLRPDLKVLFSSGYSESAIIHDGKLEDGVELVAKPYQREELARRIRQILQSERVVG